MAAPEVGIAGGTGATPDGSAGHVTFYAQTDNPKATLEKVERLAARWSCRRPETIIALFADPEGHVIGLV